MDHVYLVDFKRNLISFIYWINYFIKYFLQLEKSRISILTVKRV